MPQVCLRLIGSARPPLFASDVIARTVLPVELPVGIVTAILGAPYLIWLLARGNRGART